MPTSVRVGATSGGRTRTGGGAGVPTYPGTYSGYGATRADSVGENVAPYAYSAAQQSKAYNKGKVGDRLLTKVEPVRFDTRPEKSE